MGIPSFPVCQGVSEGCSAISCCSVPLLQEDAHAVDLNLGGKDVAMFGVFDGHAGKEVSVYCADHIVSDRLDERSKVQNMFHS